MMEEEIKLILTEQFENKSEKEIHEMVIECLDEVDNTINSYIENKK